MGQKHLTERILCDLTPGGGAVTPWPVLKWFDAALIKARENLFGPNIIGTLWGYRRQNEEYLALDLIDGQGGTHSLTFQAGHMHNFDLVQPLVPDMVEALHMAGMLVDGLGVKITNVGWRK